MTDLPHADDMTVRNFYKHMGLRHPIKELDFNTLGGKTRDGGAYLVLLAYHDREHMLHDDHDHEHLDSELT